MTFLVERLVELRRHLDHLQALRPRVADARALASDLSLHNDVLFSLLTVAQVVIDVAGDEHEAGIWNMARDKYRILDPLGQCAGNKLCPGRALNDETLKVFAESCAF